MKNIKRVIAVALAAVVLLAVAAVPAYATVYHGCPAGTGCVWADKDGGGSMLIIAVGTYGTDQCWNFGGSGDNITSSASADYGNGWDLQLYSTSGCTGGVFTRQNVHSSSFVNFTGALSYFNDSASSFKITHAL